MSANGDAQPVVLTELIAELDSISRDQRDLRRRVKSLHAVLVPLRTRNDEDFDRSDPAQVEAFIASAVIQSAGRDLGFWIRYSVLAEPLLGNARAASARAELLREQSFPGTNDRRRSQ